MTVSTETYETTASSTLNPGAIVAAARQAAMKKVSVGRRASKTNGQVIRSMKSPRVDHKADQAREAQIHKETFAKLRHNIGELALISEDLRDRNGVEKSPGPDGEQHDPIESKVQIIQPMSRRGHHLYRLDRVKLGIGPFKFRPFHPIVPKTFELGMYMRNEHRTPNAPPDPNTVQYRSKREGRAWVIPTKGKYAPDPQDNPGRTPLVPRRYRPNDLIIEVPERDQKHIRSWLGGVERWDGEPPAGDKAPRIIGTGKDGKGTYFSHGEGFKGVTTGFHEDHAMESLTAIGDPVDIDNQTKTVRSYIAAVATIKENVLNRIAEEHGVTQEQMDEYAAMPRPPKPGAPPPPPLSIPRP